MLNIDDKLDDHYTVFLGFDLNSKNMLFYPYSICGCYDGRHACSHFTSFLLLIRRAQRCDFNQDTFEKAFPGNPTHFQNKITLIENTVMQQYSRKAKRKKTNENILL